MAQFRFRAEVVVDGSDMVDRLSRLLAAGERQSIGDAHMLKTTISINRGDRYPRDISYPVIDLAIDGLITVTDPNALDPAHFPDKQLPSQ